MFLEHVLFATENHVIIVKTTTIIMIVTNIIVLLLKSLYPRHNYPHQNVIMVGLLCSRHSASVDVCGSPMM